MNSRYLLAIAVLACGVGIVGSMVVDNTAVHSVDAPDPSATLASSTALPNASTSAAGSIHGATTTGVDSETASFEPQPDPNAMAVLARIHNREASMTRGVTLANAPKPAAIKKPVGPVTLPDLKPGGDPAQTLKKAIRWFESLPNDNPLSPAKTASAKARMAKSGLDLTKKECRQGICRLSFTYMNWGTRKTPKPSANIWPEVWSFTTIGADGRPQGHVFIQNPNHR